MSTDAMRAALNEILNKEAVYGEVPGLQRPTEFALASYYWRVIGDMKRVARAALAQPVSAERVPLTESRILDLLSEHTTYDLQTGEEPPLVEDNYGSRRYASRFIDFARAIERAHGIGEPK